MHASFWRFRYRLVRRLKPLSIARRFIDGSLVATLLQTELLVPASRRDNSL